MKQSLNLQASFREVSKMVKFYVNRIRQGKMTIDEVPDRWRKTKKKVLEETE